MQSNDCQLCKIELAEMLLDSSQGCVIASVYAFVQAMNVVALANNLTLMEAVAGVIGELHADHSKGAHNVVQT